MNNSHASLLNRINKMFEKIKQQQEAAYGVVIYDPATGEPLPGYEPRPNASAQIWLPKKSDSYAGRYVA